MSTEDTDRKVEERRKRLMRAIENALSKTVENGCTEEEAAAAQANAMRLMEENSIEEWELAQAEGPRKRLMVKQELNIKYANGWRVQLASCVAFNTGVYFTYIGRANVLTYWGQEHLVKASAMIVEYLVHTVESLAKEHARKTGTGTKGRRDFAEGCANRLWVKVHDSANLTHDVRVPAIIKGAVEEGKGFAEASVGREIKNGSKQMGSKRSDYSESYVHGLQAAEAIDVRGGSRTKGIK